MEKKKGFYNDKFYDFQIDGSLSSAKIILELLWKIYQPKSVVDFGCGKGTWLFASELLGVKRLKGYDGTWVKDNLISKQIDFSSVDLEKLDIALEKFDLAISVEVAEHISEDSGKKLIRSLCDSSDVVIFSAAIKNQGGVNHINEHNQSYWVELFEKEGFTCIDYFRSQIWGNDLVECWYRQNIFLFVRSKNNLPFNVENLSNEYNKGIYNVVHPVLYDMRVKEARERERLLRESKFLLEERKKQIEIMMSSKFWKLRNNYIYLKNGLFFLFYHPIKFFNKNLRRKKLIMTLLVRDEIDIIEKNIKFHLAHGVDFIIATDNGSVDGTKEILKKYEEMGKLQLIDEPSQDYSQAVWVNRMGKIAHENYEADYVFHCDADEFWYPKSGSLKNEISRTNKKFLKVSILNVLSADLNGEEKFPDDFKYVVLNPKETKNLEADSVNGNIYLFKYPSKVIFRSGMDVTQGNHSVLGLYKNHEYDYSRDIIIYHYPVRGKKHFFRKVKNGGSSYDKNKKLEKNIGFHWRRWYESYKKGCLDDEYRKLTLSKEEKNRMLKNKSVSVLDFRNLTRQ